MILFPVEHYSLQPHKGCVQLIIDTDCSSLQSSSKELPWLVHIMKGGTHAHAALDCIQPCQHWFNCVTILTPFSSLLLENWITSLFLFPLSRLHCLHTSQQAIQANPLTKTASLRRVQGVKVSFQSPYLHTGFLTGMHVPAGTTHQLPKQSQHP